MKFILTKELGRLAKWMCILGYDASYFRLDNESRLIITALREERVILTRKAKWATHRGLKILRIESDKINDQIKQVLKELNLKPNQEMMFSRCTICNQELKGLSKEKLKGRVPEYVFDTQQAFFTCPQCNRIYWPGTHWGNVSKTLKEIMNSNQ